MQIIHETIGHLNLHADSVGLHVYRLCAAFVRESQRILFGRQHSSGSPLTQDKDEQLVTIAQHRQ